jgi:hypothetical protein
MRGAALALLLLGCAHEQRPRAAQPAAPPPSREAVLAILVRRCGECHQARRPTAVPEALRVFDLDQPDWPERFDTERFQVALQRLGNDPASDRAAFIAFHNGADRELLRARNAAR